MNFHASITPRFSVLPPVFLGSVIVALLSAALPMGLLHRVQPAIILRGSSMIELKRVSKVYPARADAKGAVIRALDEVSLSVAAGEWLAIMGPSGSGKSTMVNLIGCLDRCSAGEIWVDDEDVATISAAELNRVRAEKIGFVFQQFHLIPYLTAVENVMLAQYFHSMTDQQEALTALARVGLQDRAITCPPIFLAASSSASVLPAPSSTIPRLCSLTSPPATSTPKTKKSSCAFCAIFMPRAAPSSWSHTTRSSPAWLTAAWIFITAASPHRKSSPCPTTSSLMRC